MSGGDSSVRFVGSPVPPGAVLVRVHSDSGPLYSRMTVAWQVRDKVRVMGWIGPPLTAAEWRRAAAEFFPSAQQVEFERAGPDGALRTVTLRLR